MKKWIFLVITIILFVAVSSFLLPEVKGGERIFEDVPPELPRYRVHIVREGENLHLLAAYHYNNARLWRFIYRANKNVIKNPNLIYPEERFLIPELTGGFFVEE